MGIQLCANCQPQVIKRIQQNIAQLRGLAGKPQQLPLAKKLCIHIEEACEITRSWDQFRLQVSAAFKAVSLVPDAGAPVALTSLDADAPPEPKAPVAAPLQAPPVQTAPEGVVVNQPQQAPANVLDDTPVTEPEVTLLSPDIDE